MKCSTGKRRYPSKQMAEEALVEVRGRFYFRNDSGPIAVYQCDDCGDWHFTSKGPASGLLKDQNIQERIDNQREAEFWSQKLGR